MKTLFLIPARAGSKGIPNKNIKLLNGKPLINYAIDLARCFVKDEDICLSTDSFEIAEIAKQNNLYVPFLRPEKLSTDTAGSYEVMLHAVEFYESLGKNYEAIVLLQPTSPLRLKKHLKEALTLFKNDIEMVVSVKESQANPHWNLFKENENGYLEKFIPSNYIRRQDLPKAFEYNGAIYVINITELNKKKLNQFTKIKKVIMDDFSSVDIDLPIDLAWAEYLFNTKHIQLDY
jgi:N-acylneuraminate cytidylyltransferase